MTRVGSGATTFPIAGFIRDRDEFDFAKYNTTGKWLSNKGPVSQNISERYAVRTWTNSGLSAPLTLAVFTGDFWLRLDLGELARPHRRIRYDLVTESTAFVLRALDLVCPDATRINLRDMQTVCWSGYESLVAKRIRG